MLVETSCWVCRWLFAITLSVTYIIAEIVSLLEMLSNFHHSLVSSAHGRDDYPLLWWITRGLYEGLLTQITLRSPSRQSTAPLKTSSYLTTEALHRIIM